MDCRDFSENLQAYIDGELKEAERLELEEHLEACGSCSAELYELEKVNNLLHAAFENKPPFSAITARVLAEVTGAAPSEHPSGGELDEEIADDPSTNLVGRTLGGYEIAEKIGSGGMGTVYKALQLSMGRHVALKVLYHKYTADKTFVKRFIREARSAGGLNHPNIVRVYDVGQDNGFYYMSMELVEGHPLNQVLAQEGRLAPERALNIVIQTARALEHAQKESVIHRDVKPENIIADDADNIKLADMGLAKKIGISQDASITLEGQTVGTPYYMSPEQVIDASSVDQRTDIYSLGVTFYHIITGKRPFEGNTSMEIMASVIHNEVAFTREHLDYVPKQFVQVISKMTDKEPDRRHQTATELIKELEYIRKHRLTYATPAAAPRPRAVRAAVARREREPVSAQEKKASNLVWLVAIAAGLLLLLGVWAALPPSSTDRTDSSGNGEMARDRRDKTRVPPPSPPPAPEPTKSVVVEREEFEGEAKKEFDAVMALMAERPEDYAEQMRRLDAIVKGYPSSKHAPRAQTLYNNIVEKLNKNLAQAKAEADNLARISDFNGAVALLEDLANRYAGTDVAQTAASHARLLNERQQSKFQHDMKVAGQRLARGDTDGATYLLEKIAEYGTEEMKEQAARKIEVIHSDIAAADAARKRQQQQALLKEFYPLTTGYLVDGQYSRAIEAVDITAGASRFSGIKKYIEHERADITHLMGLSDALNAALKKMAASRRDTYLRLRDYDRPVQGRIKEISPGVFVLKPKDKKLGALITLNMKKLTPGDVVKLTGAVLEGKPEADMKYHLFYLYEGNFAKAQEHLDRLGAQHHTGKGDTGQASPREEAARATQRGISDRVKELMKKYGRAPAEDTVKKIEKALGTARSQPADKTSKTGSHPPTEKAGDTGYAICCEKFQMVKPIIMNLLAEHVAKKLYDAAKLAYRKKNYDEAQDTLERLLGEEFADTRYLDEGKRQEIAKLLKNVEAKLDKPLSERDIERDEIASLFNAAKVVKLRDGKYRVTYDFTTVEQLQDFMIGRDLIKMDHAEKLFSWREKRTFRYEDAPAWAVFRYQKYSVVNGKGERPLVWKGVIKGDATLELNAVPLQRYNVITMLCHNEKGTYVLASSFKGGDADWHRETFGMTRSVLFRRHWDEEPHIQPPNGGWQVIGEAGKMVVSVGIAYTVKAIKRGNKLAFYLNKRRLVEGVDNTWQKGRPGVSASESHVLYTGIKITGELDKEWIEEELKRLGRKKEKKEKKKKPDKVARKEDPYRGANERVKRLLDAAKGLDGITSDDLMRTRKIADGVQEWGGNWGGRVIDRLVGEVARMDNAEELRRRLDELERRMGQDPGGRPRGWPGQPQPGQQPQPGRRWPRGGRRR